MTKKVTVELDDIEEEVEEKKVAFKDQYFVTSDEGSYMTARDTFEKAEQYAHQRIVQHGKQFILKAVASVDTKADVKFFETERFV